MFIVKSVKTAAVAMTVLSVSAMRKKRLDPQVNALFDHTRSTNTSQNARLLAMGAASFLGFKEEVSSLGAHHSMCKTGIRFTFPALEELHIPGPDLQKPVPLTREPTQQEIQQGLQRVPIDVDDYRAEKDVKFQQFLESCSQLNGDYVMQCEGKKRYFEKTVVVDDKKDTFRIERRRDVKLGRNKWVICKQAPQTGKEDPPVFDETSVYTLNKDPRYGWVVKIENKFDRLDKTGRSTAARPPTPTQEQNADIQAGQPFNIADYRFRRGVRADRLESHKRFTMDLPGCCKSY